MALALKIHNREIAMYGGLFPQLQKLKNEAGLSADQVPLDVPNSYYVNVDENDGTGTGTVIVMEELKGPGFVMVEKVNGCDFEHAKLSLTSLAHYHALTIAFLRKHVTREGETVVYPSVVDFLNQPSPNEMMPIELIKGPFENSVKLMNLVGRHDVSNLNNNNFSDFETDLTALFYRTLLFSNNFLKN